MSGSMRLEKVACSGQLADVEISDGRIVEIKNLGPAGPDDLIVIPGMIDLHVHSRQPGGDQKEDWEHLWQAAAKGGVTTIVTMPNTSPPIVSFELLKQARALAKDSPIKPLFWFGATVDNHEEIGKSVHERDVVGIKMFMGSSTGDLLIADPAEQAKIFELGAELDCPVAVHAEDEETINASLDEFALRFENHFLIRGVEAEVRSVLRAINLAHASGCKLYLCHVSSAVTAEVASLLKRNFYDLIWLEATPHHLLLSNLSVTGPLAGHFKMNPPLRPATEMAKLKDLLVHGWIDTIGSDHAPHHQDEKDQPYEKCPSGVPGIETSLPLMIDWALSGKLDWDLLQDMVAAMPARIIGRKDLGRITIGAQADLVVVDPNSRVVIENKDILSKCAWTPFDGWELKGRIVKTIKDGAVIYAI